MSVINFFIDFEKKVKNGSNAEIESFISEHGEEIKKYTLDEVKRLKDSNFHKGFLKRVLNKRSVKSTFKANVLLNLSEPIIHEFGHYSAHELIENKSFAELEKLGLVSEEGHVEMDTVYNDILKVFGEGKKENLADAVNKITGIGTRGAVGWTVWTDTLGINILQNNIYLKNKVLKIIEGRDTDYSKFETFDSAKELIFIDIEEERDGAHSIIDRSKFGEWSSDGFSLSEGYYAIADEDKMYILNERDYNDLIKIHPEYKDKIFPPGTILKNVSSLEVDDSLLKDFKKFIIPRVKEKLANLEEVNKLLENYWKDNVISLLAGPVFQECFVLSLLALMRKWKDTPNRRDFIKRMILLSELRRTGYSLMASMGEGDYAYFVKYIQSFGMDFNLALAAVWGFSFLVTFSIIKVMGRMSAFQSIVSSDEIAQGLYGLSKKEVDEITKAFLPQYAEEIMTFEAKKTEKLNSILERNAEKFYDLFSKITIEFKNYLLASNKKKARKVLRKSFEKIGSFIIDHSEEVIGKLNLDEIKHLEKELPVIAFFRKSSNVREEYGIYSDFLEKFMAGDSFERFMEWTDNKFRIFTKNNVSDKPVNDFIVMMSTLEINPISMFIFLILASKKSKVNVLRGILNREDKVISQKGIVAMDMIYYYLNRKDWVHERLNEFRINLQRFSQ